MNRGALGEALAAQYLAAHGYTIVARNFRTRYGEIDLIAQKDGFVAFVEVKLRANARYGAPYEAVNAVKQRKILAAAQAWLLEHPDSGQPRFDIVELLFPAGAARPLVRHWENAFDA